MQCHAILLLPCQQHITLFWKQTNTILALLMKALSIYNCERAAVDGRQLQAPSSQLLPKRHNFNTILAMLVINLLTSPILSLERLKHAMASSNSKYSWSLPAKLLL